MMLIEIFTAPECIPSDAKCSSDFPFVLAVSSWDFMFSLPLHGAAAMGNTMGLPASPTSLFHYQNRLNFTQLTPVGPGGGPAATAARHASWFSGGNSPSWVKTASFPPPSAQRG